jgi:molybdate/tungstate transport system substrate-binding protein
MSTQRGGSGTDPARESTQASEPRASGGRSATRRGFLAAVGTGVAGLGGCVGSAGVLGGGRAVSVLAAGSLQSAFEDGLAGAVEPTLEVEAHGSVTVARLVAEGKRDPDIVALADTALFDGPLAADWHAAFATNALVVAYDAESEAGRRVGAADRWFDPLLAGDATLGRTDPDLDPLGYRTLFALALAGEYYDRPGLRDALADPRAVYPETSLLSRLETGDLDAAVVYRSMAEDRGYDYVDLPVEIDLSDPARADAYREVSYDLPTGETVRGAPIAYGAVARHDAERVAETFQTLVDGGYLGDHGFAVPDTFPEYSGDVPRVHRP